MKPARGLALALLVGCAGASPEPAAREANPNRHHARRHTRGGGASVAREGTTAGAAPNGSSAAQGSGSPRAAGAYGPSPQDLIRAQEPAFRQCYEREALTRDHTVAGSVEVRVVLEASGAIARAEVSAQSTHEDPTLMELVARCVEQRVRALGFGPQPAGGLESVVPLSFVP